MEARPQKERPIHTSYLYCARSMARIHSCCERQHAIGSIPLLSINLRPTADLRAKADLQKGGSISWALVGSKEHLIRPLLLYTVKDFLPVTGPEIVYSWKPLSTMILKLSVRSTVYNGHRN
jgi:hypothetical protein